MSGHYLYCQNTSCGVYLGCSGGDDCYICGWRAGRNMNDDDDDEPCPECGTPGCQGHCAGDDMMGDN